MASIAVVIISYNTRELLRNCLRSVLASSPAEVVVVDNGSSDGSVDMVRDVFPSVLLMVDPSNPGYGTAANRAVKRTRSEFVVVLNSDTVVPPDALHAMAGYLNQHPCVAVLGPRLLNADGSLQRSCRRFPTPLLPQIKQMPFAHTIRQIPVLRELFLTTWSHAYAREVPWVMGAALAIRRKAFDAIRGFDESYFMYYEETDLCYRLQRAGWRIHFAPVTDIVHLGGASTGQLRVEMRTELFRSALHFYERHYAGMKFQLAATVLKLSFRLRVVREGVRYYLSRRPEHRMRLSENMGVWYTLLKERTWKP